MKQQNKKLTCNTTINSAARHAGRQHIKNRILLASSCGSVIACALKLNQKIGD